CSAAAWAFGIVYTRKAAASDGLATTLGYSAAIGFVVLSAAQPFVFVPPTPVRLMQGVAMAACWLLAHVCLAVAYQSSRSQV
ncbi:hypothetical protein, partial [Stenotrophomonas maltophilia]|uniref:hypothetical protein n=1 Tax=Stenotrophomonas maltophilia TaxID=40324 RepID=UPI001952BF5E